MESRQQRARRDVGTHGLLNQELRFKFSYWKMGIWAESSWSHTSSTLGNGSIALQCSAARSAARIGVAVPELPDGPQTSFVGSPHVLPMGGLSLSGCRSADGRFLLIPGSAAITNLHSPPPGLWGTAISHLRLHKM